MRRILGMFVALTALSFGVFGCGGGTTEDTGPKALTSLADYLRARNYISMYYFETFYLPTLTSDTSGAMMGEVYRSTDATLTYHAVIHTPGTSGKSVGEVLCTFVDDETLSSVESFDPLERVSRSTTGTFDDCGFGSVGLEGSENFVTLLKDSSGAPLVVGNWASADPAEDIPTDGYKWEGGSIQPILICPEGASYGDPGCSATCYWGPGTGAGCPTLTSGTSGLEAAVATVQ